MKYTKEQRLDIGRRIYDGEFTFVTAAETFDINVYTARTYMRIYRDTNGLPAKSMNYEGFKSHASASTASDDSSDSSSLTASTTPTEGLEQYQEMTKEELIRALIQARITEARLKKGYEVKGDGSIIQYSSKNTK